MRVVCEEITISADPATVWSVGGDVGGIAAWIPSVESCRMDGDLRYSTLVGGGEVVERITRCSDGERFYEYEFVGGAFPLTTYTSRFSVESSPEGSLVRWIGTLSADDEEGMAAAVRTSYRAGLAMLRDRLEPPRRVIVVDHERCEGHGRCYGLAPELFAPMDDHGRAEFIGKPIVSADAAATRGDQAVQSCPEGALAWAVAERD